MNDYLTVTDAAEAAGLKPAAIRKAIRLGYIKARKFGPVWQVERTSYEAWRAAERKPGPKPRLDRG